MKKEDIKNLEDALQYITEIEEMQDSKTIEIEMISTTPKSRDMGLNPWREL